MREVLEAVYEQDFLDCSYGFRPGRSAHDAIRRLDHIVHRGEVSWILEADISSFFDSLDRTKLKEMLETRVADGSLMRLIGKCLHVGILDGAAYSTPELGAAQGSVLSPPLVLRVDGVFQDERVNASGAGTGNTSPDATLAPLTLRAERNGNVQTPGEGRVYHVFFTADDGAGGQCKGEVTVCVPHDQGARATCVDGGPLYDSTL